MCTALNTEMLAASEIFPNLQSPCFLMSLVLPLPHGLCLFPLGLQTIFKPKQT